MDRMTLSALRRLTATRHSHCVSIYLPTHVSGPEAPQDALRIKNLADQAEARLVEHGLRPVEARDMLQAVRALPLDPAQWQRRGAGLALFVTPDQQQVFSVSMPVAEYVAVNRRFHIKPLLPVVLGDQQFYVLAFSKNHPRLILASRDAAEEVPVPGMPERIEVALNYQTAERGAQVHSAARGGDASTKAAGGVFHGQGGGPDASKEELSQYLRMVADAVRPVVGETRLPLVVHAVEYVVPRLKEVWDYPLLVSEAVTGSPDHLRPDQLRDRAWPLVATFIDQSRDRAIAKFQQLFGTGKASDNILEIAPALQEGKVECLFVDTAAALWGAVDPQTQKVEVRTEPRAGDEDLVDWAAVATLDQRGAVFAVPAGAMPSASPVAAVFRY
jgi:hypothetical protein